MWAAVRRLRDHELWWHFTRSPLAVGSAGLVLAFVLGALTAPWLAPHDPFDPARVFLADAFLPPVWVEGGDPRFLLGTDDQGRCVLSTILWGARISFFVGVSAVAFSAALGTVLGISAGYVGGAYESLVMRAADVQLTFPGILVALLIGGIARTLVPPALLEAAAVWVVVASIGIAGWPQYARIARAVTLVETSKDYIAAAQVMGLHPVRIMFRHLLPNVIGPISVVGTIGLALAIVSEATLSFLGVGVPPTTPSLGTLIRIGNDFLFSGEWWIVFFPSLALVLLVSAVNLLGDWLRDALDPKLR
ncbi:MAG: ABC transporter permease [Geminicoccaceae bacterium]|nr:ABC transporter permease [Geminicoccaceae bacterium]